MRHLSTLLWALLLIAVPRVAAQIEPHTPASVALASPDNISHALLTPRSALPLYPSREQMDAAAASDFIIPLESWQVDSLPEGTRYTARFKRNYRFDDKEMVLRVEGATGAISVAVNDVEVGYTSAGRGRSEFDLTKKLKENHNTIAITVHRNYAAQALEGTSTTPLTFRKAALLTPPRVAVADYVVATKFNKQGDGLLNLGVVMQSFLLNSKDYTVYYELYSPEGKLLTSANKVVTTAMLSRDTVNFFTRVPAAKRWSPEEPNLYRLVVYTRHENRIKEFTTKQIGFRTAEADESGLVLNGTPIDIKATTIHPEQAEPTESELNKLRKEGYNLVFTPRPASDEFYSLCDKVGMLVCTSADITTPDLDISSSPSNNPLWRESYIWRAQMAYHTTKLHPSVVMFAIGHNAQNGICLYESYLAMKAIEGETRPIVYPDAAGEWNTDL